MLDGIRSKTRKEVEDKLHRGKAVRAAMHSCLNQMTDGRLKSEAMLLYGMTLLHDRAEQLTLIIQNDDISNTKAKETAEYICLVNDGLKAYLTELGVYLEDE